jgi:hypothetical protein
LKPKFGTNYKVTGNMIGINKAGEVRVWINRDFSKIQKENEYPKSDGEHNLLTTLFQAVESSMESGKFPAHFHAEKSRLPTPYTF